MDDEVVEGKLVAALMFGFWVKLLGRGSFAGKQPLRARRIYDSLLWQPALARALPLAPNRRDAEHAASVVRAIASHTTSTSPGASRCLDSAGG